VYTCTIMAEQCIPAQNLHSDEHHLLKSNSSNYLGMVEAAGVEPASEGVVSREPTYLVAFTLAGWPTFAARAENATRNASR
jgi:hypothetical protein